MRQSRLFTKTRREAPKDEVAKNAQLLIRAGYIHKEMAGVYSYLPLGLRVLNNIIQIIREEINAIGGVELYMSALQRPDLWAKTGRWLPTVHNWFTTKLLEGADLGLAFTHEEPLTALMREHIASHKDLPRYVYQFQTKFRNEERAKSGIMRTREFIMKDLYSFSQSQVEHQAFYDEVTKAYRNIFQRVGLGDKTYLTRASGGTFSKISHEFQTICDAGEDTIHVSPDIDIAVNEEIINEAAAFENISASRSNFKPIKAVEVGNIFSLGTRFSEALGLTYKDKEGKDVPVIMGSYGIGPGRVMGTIVEVLSDKKGIVWPASVAPFPVHLVSISGGNADVIAEADRMYDLLKENGIEALYDDRDVRAGEKFADSDLIGIPTRLVVSEKTMAQAGLEAVDRKDGTTTMIAESEIVERLSK